MKVRRGFISIAWQKMRRLDFPWLIRQGKKYWGIKRALRRGDGRALCGPVIAHFFCTCRCNLKCPMCDIPTREKGAEINTGQGFQIIDELAELGASGVSFTGGEPLLRPDIFDFIRRAKALDLDTILVTNGLRLANLASEVIQAGPDVVNVSIDGSVPRIHDRSRGCKGAFERSIKGVESLKRLIERQRSDMQIVASTVLSQENIYDLGNIISLCRDSGIDRVILCPLHEFRDACCYVSPVIVDYDVQAFLLGHADRALIDNSDRYLSHLNSVLRGDQPPPGCRAGYTTLIIDYEGHVYTCKCNFENRQKIASLFSKGRSLKEIWYSEAYDVFRRGCCKCQRCYLTINREFDGLFG